MENQQPQTLNQAENSEMYPTVRLCWEIFLKTWKWFVLSVVLSLVIAYLYSNSRTRIYQRQSVMLIEDSEGSGGGMGTSRSRRGAANAVMELNGISVGDNFKNELFIISSQRLMERVVDSLQLNVDYTTRTGLRTTTLYKHTPVVVAFDKSKDNDNVLSLTIRVLGNGRFQLSNFNLNGTSTEQTITATAETPVRTPIGTITTSHYPREACGPDLNQIMMGSEGTFGVLTEVTLKIFRWMPENRKRFSYIFKTWDDAMKAAREMMQHECGYSSVFRLSDQEETSMMLRLYNVDDTPLYPLLDKLGYKDMERCLFLGFTDGEKGYSKNVAKNIAKIARQHGGLPLTGYVTKSWEKGRFNDPYLRDTLMDFGITTDTLECTVNWSNMEQVHLDVRKVCHALPNTVVTTHMSHCYPQGANLYFIFLTKMQDEKAFKAYHTTILDAIQRSGASISHHHGIGKMFAPWLEGYVGEKEYGVFKVLKNYFDPKYNMNPGGTIGLDLLPEEKKFDRQYTDYEAQQKFD